MSKQRIALATYDERPDLTEGDQLLQDTLINYGYDAKAENWEDNSVPWEDYDAVLIRSTWNYYEKHDQFIDWINQLEKSDVEVWNPPDVLRWNTEKWYLKDLREAGLPIVPTTFVPKNTSIDLKQIKAEKDWEHVIVKPIVGAGSHKLFGSDSTPDQRTEQRFRQMVQETGALVQPFQPAISKGEYSMFFFLQEYSYCIRKKPVNDDFRAHQDYDAEFEVVEPDQQHLDRANTFIRKINKPWLYARLDYLVSGDEIRIMEVEMTEPNFYFEKYPDGADQFAESFRDLLEGEAEPDQGGLGFTIGH